MDFKSPIHNFMTFIFVYSVITSTFLFSEVKITGKDINIKESKYLNWLNMSHNSIFLAPYVHRLSKQ
jgi:hypothetical protein